MSPENQKKINDLREDYSYKTSKLFNMQFGTPEYHALDKEMDDMVNQIYNILNEENTDERS